MPISLPLKLPREFLAALRLDRVVATLALLALGLELWVLFSDVHFLWKPVETGTPRETVAHLSDTSNSVMLRTPLQLSWSRPTMGQELREGDEIATLSDSTATIEFSDHRKLTLGPNSLLVVRRRLPLGDSVFRLALLRGTILQEGLTAANPPKNVEIEVRGRKLVPNPGQGFTVQPQEPKPGAPIDLVINHLPSGSFSSPPVPGNAPLLSTPENEEEVKNSEPVRFVWRLPTNPGEPAIEVSRDAHFHDVLLNHKLPRGTNAVEFEPRHKGHYYWRVRLGDGNGATYSGTREFDVIFDLSKPQLIRPQIESSSSAPDHKLQAPQLKIPTIRYQGTQLIWRAMGVALQWLIPSAQAAEDTPVRAAGGERYSVKLSWYPVGGAHAYTLQISTDPSFAHLAAEKIIVEPSYSWHTSVPGFYYWRVAAVDAEGDRGPFSEFMTFDVKAQRNVVGDETSYDTYLKFDEYSGHSQRFQFLVGPEFSRYMFHSNATSVSPAAVRYDGFTVRQFQGTYAYRLNNYYSLDFKLSTEATTLTSGSFFNDAGQRPLHQNETSLDTGIERRFFYPHHYLTLQTGVRTTFVDIPQKQSDTQLSLSTLTFIGVYAVGGYHLPLTNTFEVAGGGGGFFQYTSGSSRFGPTAFESFTKEISDIFSIGLRFEQEYRRIALQTDTISGTATQVDLRAMAMIEFNF